MHLGVPVIARKNTGNESIVKDGENGLLFESPEVSVNLDFEEKTAALWGLRRCKKYSPLTTFGSVDV